MRVEAIEAVLFVLESLDDESLICTNCFEASCVCGLVAYWPLVHILAKLRCELNSELERISRVSYND